MPHQCTSCGHEFSDGSKEMLSGCPDCGGNKFQFYPSGSMPDPEEQPPERESSVTQSVGKATTKVRDWVRRDETPPANAPAEAAASSGQDEADSIIEAPDDPVGNEDREDRAQASARGEMVSPDELPKKPEKQPPAEGRVVGSPKEERPSMEDLREELNDQFESIKILEPGQYELNLMELYDRDEYIIALQENGRYIIEVPETWLGGRDKDEK